MPKRPKPRTLRSQTTALTVIDGEKRPRPAPPPPAGMLDTYEAKWAAFWSSPLVAVVVPELDLDTIETLFRLRDERERALRAGRRKRLVPGSQGQPVLNPLLDYALKVQ